MTKTVDMRAREVVPCGEWDWGLDAHGKTQAAPYRRRGSEEPPLRVVVMMPKGEAKAIEKWAVPAGMPSRMSAVRFLLKKGLETLQAERARRSA